MTFPSLTKRPTTRPNSDRRSPRRNFLRPFLFALATLFAAPLASSQTAHGQDARTTGWSTRRQVPVRSTSGSSHTTFRTNDLHRRRLNWGSTQGRPTPASPGAFRQADRWSGGAVPNSPAATVEQRESLRRSLQHHALSRPVAGSSARNVAHESQTTYGAQDYLHGRASRVPATPWEEGFSSTAATHDSYDADPFADPFGDRQHQPAPSRRVDRAVFGKATPSGASNVFDESAGGAQGHSAIQAFNRRKRAGRFSRSTHGRRTKVAGSGLHAASGRATVQGTNAF